MIFLDTWREIRHSLGRFFSILAIVCIGVAFFAGLKAADPDMKYSADAYFDQTNFADYIIYSTYGITEDDIAALKQTPGVHGVYGSYTLDLLGRIAHSEPVLRLQSIPDLLVKENPNYINQLILLEGRMPEKPNEAVVAASTFYDYKIGDVFHLKTGNKTPLNQQVRYDTLTIVGIVQSPTILDYEGSAATNVGSGTVNAFLFVKEEVFKSDVYMSAFVTVRDAKQFNSYKDDYFAFLRATDSSLKTLGNERSLIRKDEVIGKAEAQLAEKQKEYEEGKAQFEEEIAKAQAQIDAGKDQLLMAQVELNVNQSNLTMVEELAKTQLGEFEKTLADLQNQYDAGKSEYEAAKSTAQTRKNELNSQIAAIDALYPNLQNDVISLNNQITTLQTEIIQIQLDPNLSDAQKAEAVALRQAQITTLTAQLAPLAAAQTERQTLVAEVQYIDSSLSYLQTAIDTTDAQIQAVTKQYEDAKAELAKMISDAKAEIAAGQRKINAMTNTLTQAQITLGIEKKKGEAALADAASQLLEAKQQIELLQDPKWVIMDRTQMTVSYVNYGDAADRIAAIASIFPLFFYLVAALVALTTITRMVDEQRQLIGTFKALGYSKGTIALKYIIYAFSASFIGSIIGLAFGMQLFPLLVFKAWGIVYNVPRLYFESQPGLMLLSAGIGIGVSILAALTACFSELVASPAMLMRPKAPKNGKTILLERFPFLWKRLSFIWKVTMRNLFRYKQRFLMAIIGVAGSTCLLITAFGIRDSISAVVPIQFEQLFQYQLNITLKEEYGTFEREEFLDLIKGKQAVKDAILISQTSATITYGKKDSAVTLMVSDQDGKLDDFIRFQSPSSHKEIYLEDGILISYKLARDLGIKTGDTVSIENNLGFTASFEVDGIVENYSGHYIYMNHDTYESSYKLSTNYNAILIQTKDLDREGKVALASEIGTDDRVSYILNFETLADEIDDMILSLDFVAVALIISAGALAFVVLYNLNNVNITERQREIATIKVLGFLPKETASYINRESILLTLIGSVAGIFLGLVLHGIVMNAAELDNVMFTRDIFTQSYFYSMGLTLVFALIVNFVLGFKIRGVKMVESLKSVE
ncbi:MAG: ABC transporter permease [Erysipelotrichaceae bacterium]|jgi:putative ABC transport system permease protein|nr:ABC transporter permease [Erysipelotrichaceae bacterium]